jgi:hypothetical protein
VRLAGGRVDGLEGTAVGGFALLPVDEQLKI